jgi:sec-independent protein translocase protein TatA
MGSLSFSHLLLIIVVVLLVFGAGRLPRLMGDLAKGLKSFREGMKDEESSQSTSAQKLAAKPLVKKKSKKSSVIKPEK